jgi:CBS-domain-containing membrane protein
LKQGGQLPRQIGAVMNRYVPTVRPDASLADVFDAVVATRLHRAVVVDESGQPIGIIVDTDLLPQITPSAHPSAMRRLMHRVLPATPEMEKTWQRQSGQRAADVMRPRVAMLVVPISAPLTEVIDRSLARRSKLITIVDDAGRVVGMADRADLLAALAAAI